MQTVNWNNWWLGTAFCIPMNSSFRPVGNEAANDSVKMKTCAEWQSWSQEYESYSRTKKVFFFLPFIMVEQANYSFIVLIRSETVRWLGQLGILWAILHIRVIRLRHLEAKWQNVDFPWFHLQIIKGINWQAKLKLKKLAIMCYRFLFRQKSFGPLLDFDDSSRTRN